MRRCILTVRMSDAPQPKPSADPRTYFAAERTFLAWVRTGIALMGFGFVLARFGFFLRELQLAQKLTAPHSTGYSLSIGIALVVLGVGVQIYAAVWHVKMIRQLRAGQSPGEHWSVMGVVVAVLLAMVGTAMAVYLMLVR